MSNLEAIDRIKLEKLFEMEDGYVLNFTNKTFSGFISDILNIDIYNFYYAKIGESKANRLRYIWRILDNNDVAKVIEALIEYQQLICLNDSKKNNETKELVETCRKIVGKLRTDNISTDMTEIEEISPNLDNINELLSEIRSQIKNDQPEFALDRLHTLSVKFIRGLCTKHEINYDNNKPLHSMYGEYVKELERKEIIETGMTKKILKYSISIFDAFNYVRNNKSYAHDNEILNYDESMLIYRAMASIITYICSVEKKRDEEDN